MKRVLLDHCIPRPFRDFVTNCSVSTAAEMGWEQLKNGELLAAAEQGGFEVLITADKNLQYQQNLAARRIAIIELADEPLARRCQLRAPGECSTGHNESRRLCRHRFLTDRIPQHRLRSIWQQTGNSQPRQLEFGHARIRPNGIRSH